MKDKRTTNNIEMEANQQAYNTDGARDESGDYIVENNERIHVGGAEKINLMNNGDFKSQDRVRTTLNRDDIRKTLIRTDVDSHEDYRSKLLQNQEKIPIVEIILAFH